MLRGRRRLQEGDFEEGWTIFFTRAPAGIIEARRVHYGAHPASSLRYHRLASAYGSVSRAFRSP